MILYRLGPNKEIIRETDILTWGRWFETADRQVAFDEIPGIVQLSTVFLGVDHAFSSKPHPPVLFETMVFFAPDTCLVAEAGQSVEQRYCTWEEAEAGHNDMLKVLSDRVIALTRESHALTEQAMNKARTQNNS
jgi:hypothetical protein